MNNIISVSGLCFAYDDNEVLHNINLDIERGSLVAILGRNGCGKSTLARHFNAIALPSGGKVYVDGLDTSDENNQFAVRSRAGMVFQNPDNQAVAVLVEDDAAFAPENLGIEPHEIRRRVDEALAAVGMSEYALKPITSLSGGQKQRVAIAGILAMQPEIMIFDEATAMLDPCGRKEVMDTVRRINRENGTTVVYITHYMDEAALADRVIVMDGGSIIMNGIPREIFARASELEKAGLDIPQVTRTAWELKKAGVDIRTDIISTEELAKEIIRVYDNTRKR